MVLYDEKEDLKTKKLSQNDISLNDIFQKNFEQNKEKMILFMDDKNQVWEITPQPHLTEDILKQGNYQFLKSLETVKIYNNEYNTDNKNEKDSKDKNDDIDDDIEVTMNSSFYNEKYDENYNEYIRSDNFDILEESQDSNIANIERRLKG